MKILLNGRSGKVGSVLAPGLEKNGHTLVETLHDAEAMVDFTAPEAALANVEAANEFSAAVLAFLSSQES